MTTMTRAITMTTTRSSRSTAARRLRRAFSFIEVMFAVMILGVGFLMIAAMFPVAIAQSKDAIESSTGMAVAQNGAQYVKAMKTAAWPPGTGAAPDVQVDYESITPNVFEALRGSFVHGADQRYAWLPVYKRENGAAGMSLWVIAVRTRNETRDTFTNPTNPNWLAQHLANDLRPHRLTVTFTKGTAPAPDLVTFENDQTTVVPHEPRKSLAAEGAFLIIAHYAADPTLNGQIYRLGSVENAAGTVWRLAPGYDLRSRTTYPANAVPVDVLIVGRGLRDPLKPFNGDSGSADYNPCEGPVQDVAIYPTDDGGLTLP